MEDSITLHPSASQEAIDFLVDSGLDRVHAESLLRPIGSTEQSSGTLPVPTRPSQSGGTPFEERVLAVMESFGQRLDQLAARIDGVSVVDETSTEVGATPTPPRQTPRSWADRPLDETPNYLPILRWPDDEEPSGQNLLEVSEATSTLLTANFSRPLTNSARLALKKGYGVPKVSVQNWTAS